MTTIEVTYAGAACPERDTRILEACGLDNLADEGELDGVRDLSFTYGNPRDVVAVVHALRFERFTFTVEAA